MKILTIIILIWSVNACATETEQITSSSRNSLPPVKAFLERGLFTIEGCPQIKPSKFGVVRSIPTVQEAILAGYRPSITPACAESVRQRLAKEREMLGEIKATPEIENLKAELLLSRRLDSLEDENDRLKAKQEEAERQQERMQDDLDTKIDK